MQPDHSLAGTFDANYGGAIGDFWHEVAHSLPLNASLLDLATGNAPLPRLLLGQRPDLRIDAIDAADIAPDWPIPAGAMPPRIHPRTSCEALPFADASFDLVSTQYGIEYSNLALSIAEIARVLQPNGRLAAIIHSADSRIAEVTRDELKHTRLILAPAAALDSIEAMIPLMAVAGTNEGRQKLNADPAARITRDNFNAAMSGVQEAIKQATAPDLLLEFLQWAPQTLNFAATTGDASAALQKYHIYRQQLEDASERYRALLSAALGSTEQDHLIKLLGDNGLRTEGCSPLNQNGYSLGISLVARRS